MKRKLGVNTATGIINIIVGVISLIGFISLIASSFELVSLMDSIGITDTDELLYYYDIFDLISPTTIFLFIGGWIFSIISIIMSIISIVMSKKNGISIAGPIVSLCGSSFNLFVLFIFTGPVVIIGGIIGLIQKNIEKFELNDTELLNMDKVDELKQVNYSGSETDSKSEIGTEHEWDL